MKIHHTITAADRRKRRVRAKLHGTHDRPRVSVYRSSKHVSMQAIDDDKAVTLAAASEHDVKEKGTKIARAVMVAKIFAEKLKKASITTVIFDRGSYRYFGRVKAVADALREAGIKV